MRIFITGSTGFIGSALVVELLKKQHTIHALYRDPDKIIIRHQKLHYFKGDVGDMESLEKAMQGCTYVFHLAAYAKVWARDPRMFYRVNVTGTRNVLEVALNLKIKRVIITSTAGVIGYSANYEANENHFAKNDYFTEYEKTKHLAEVEVEKYNDTDLETVSLLPTRLYGPGLLSESNTLTLLIKKYIDGKWHFLPGNGKKTGNYVFIQDVIRGHINAMFKDVAGERFILGGTNIGYNNFFATIGKVSGKKQWMLPIPVFIILLGSGIMWLLAITLKIKPLLTPAWAKKYLHDWNVSSQKAIKKLDYSITPLEIGLEETIKWLRSKRNEL